MSPREKVQALYAALAAGDASTLPELVGRDYVPHCADLNGLAQPEPGLDALRARVERTGGLPHEVHRIIADDDLVCAHVRYDGEIPVAGLDLFRLDGEGMIVEHWASRQPIPNDDARGVDRFGGGGRPDLPVSPERRAEMRKVMQDLLRGVWAEGRPELVPVHYAPHYVQHNPDMPGGAERIREIVETNIADYRARTGGDFPIEIHQIGAGGDLIFVRYSIFMAGIGRMEGSRATNTDIFRIDADNRMIEHWDVLEMHGEPMPDTRTLF